MGGPKEELVLGGETMLARQVRQLRSVCRSVAVVGSGRNRQDSEVPLLADRIPAHGPLGGILTALEETRSEFNLIVACDLPFLEIRFLRLLAREALLFGADVTVPEDISHRWHPLCGVYRRGLRGIIRGRVVHGANKADGYFRHVRLRVLKWREIVGAGFSSHIFDNINRPAEFEEAKRLLDAISGSSPVASGRTS